MRKTAFLHWVDKTTYKMALIAIIYLGVAVFTVTPVFASGKSSESGNTQKKMVINGSAQMTVAQLKSLAAEKKEAGVEQDDTEVKRYLSGEVAYFYNEEKSDKQEELSTDNESLAETEAADNIAFVSETTGTDSKNEGSGTEPTKTVLTLFLNSKADYADNTDNVMRLDPEETLTKEQEEEVLSTTEIERYVNSNYSVLQQFTNESEYTTKARQAVISYAMKFIGNPYVWGGTSLTRGADCSGFVQEIFRHFGIITGRTSRDQYANCIYLRGREVMPGDLIFYADETGYINHVAIYAGNYMIIHAANRTAGIKVNRYDYKKPYAYGRFIAN